MVRSSRAPEEGEKLNSRLTLPAPPASISDDEILFVYLTKRRTFLHSISFHPRQRQGPFSLFAAKNTLFCKIYSPFVFIKGSLSLLLPLSGSENTSFSSSPCLSGWLIELKTCRYKKSIILMPSVFLVDGECFLCFYKQIEPRNVVSTQIWFQLSDKMV